MGYIALNVEHPYQMPLVQRKNGCINFLSYGEITFRPRACPLHFQCLPCNWSNSSLSFTSATCGQEEIALHCFEKHLSLDSRAKKSLATPWETQDRAGSAEQ